MIKHFFSLHEHCIWKILILNPKSYQPNFKMRKGVEIGSLHSEWLLEKQTMCSFCSESKATWRPLYYVNWGNTTNVIWNRVSLHNSMGHHLIYVVQCIMYTPVYRSLACTNINSSSGLWEYLSFCPLWWRYWGCLSLYVWDNRIEKKIYVYIGISIESYHKVPETLEFL